MQGEHLKDALLKGTPIAKEYEKISKKYESAKTPFFIGGILLTIILSVLFVNHVINLYNQPISIIGYFLEAPRYIIVGILISCAVVSMISFVVPIVSYISLGFVLLVGKCLFFKKQKRLKKEVDMKIEQFVQVTKLPNQYCNTHILSKFTYYLDTLQADNLKDCINIYNEEERHEKLLKEIKELKEEVASVGDSVTSVGSSLNDINNRMH
jgi:hypothetical protein